MPQETIARDALEHRDAHEVPSFRMAFVRFTLSLALTVTVMVAAAGV